MNIYLGKNNQIHDYKELSMEPIIGKAILEKGSSLMLVPILSTTIINSYKLIRYTARSDSLAKQAIRRSDAYSIHGKFWYIPI